ESAGLRPCSPAFRSCPTGPRAGDPDPAAGPWADTHGTPDPGRVDPRVLGALLARHGWRRRGGAAGRYSRWTPPGTGTGT
ncbi:hypothetical protein ABGT92_27140, partial [Streptomyces cinereoruber]